MTRYDIHEPTDFFEYVRLDDGSIPLPEPTKVDVAILDMNHAWPNVGHDALVHAVVEAAEGLREELRSAGLRVRIISFDVRRRQQVPRHDGRFQLYVGTGGPGHLDPRKNDGLSHYAQGIVESDAWEKPLFRLFDDVLADDEASLIAICHSFGLLCRWSKAAHPELRAEKSSGMPTNVLTDDAGQHPWFSQFAQMLPDQRHFRVVDNRLFDLVIASPVSGLPLALEREGSEVVTMLELARHADSGMPRIVGANHHPEIVDREHIRTILEEKRAHGEVDDRWYYERTYTMDQLFRGENERQSRLTSHYSLLGPLRHQLGRMLRSR